MGAGISARMSAPARTNILNPALRPEDQLLRFALHIKLGAS
jgi:hypothetical protein